MISKLITEELDHNECLIMTGITAIWSISDHIQKYSAQYSYYIP